MTPAKTAQQLEVQIAHELDAVSQATERIRLVLQEHAGKTLKGGEVVGWLGEVYAKLLLGGDIVDDSFDYDVLTVDGRRVAVKARRQTPGKSGWKQTSPIPRIDGDSNELPTHLMFLHLDQHFRLVDKWLFPWDTIYDRFRAHKVHGEHRSYLFSVAPTKDRPWLWPHGEHWAAD